MGSDEEKVSLSGSESRQGRGFTNKADATRKKRKVKKVDHQIANKVKREETFKKGVTCEQKNNLNFKPNQSEI